MCPLLEFEADRRAFLITINSFGTELTKDTREKLYPSCGKLYPQGLKMLSNCDDFEQVRQVADSYANYRALFDGVGQGQSSSLFYFSKKILGSQNFLRSNTFLGLGNLFESKIFWSQTFLETFKGIKIFVYTILRFRNW